MTTAKLHIYQMREIMWSKNTIDSEDSEETSINKTGDITNLELARIEMTRTPNTCLCYIVMTVTKSSLKPLSTVQDRKRNSKIL